MLNAFIIFICIHSSISLCTAQTKDETQLIELMDIMLEDFLNPKKPASITPNAEQKPRILQDSAVPIETEPITSSTLPQAYTPVMPAHEPLAENYSFPEQKQPPSTQTIPSQSVPAQGQHTQQQNLQSQTLPQTQPINTQPVHSQQQTKPVATQTTQSQQNNTQQQPKKNADEVISNTQQTQHSETEQIQESIENIEYDNYAQSESSSSEEFGDIVFTETMLQENYFQSVNTLTGNFEYNSYNSKFKTLGFSLMFDHSLKQNASIGVLGGGFIEFSDGFKIRGLDFSKTILEAEAAAFYRHYIMTDTMKAIRPYGWGFYLQPELGAAVAFNKEGLIKDQLGLKVSPLGALRVGYRAYIRKSPLYIEPFLRVGYPFVAGGGIGFGLNI